MRIHTDNCLATVEYEDNHPSNTEDKERCVRQLPRILLLLVATAIVIVALLVSGLRLVMPHLDSYRSEILATVSRAIGVSVTGEEVRGRWETFGPTLQIRDLRVDMQENGKLDIARVTLALDVWQSLLHWRWQFRDLTFWQLRLDSNRPLFPAMKRKTVSNPDASTNSFCVSSTISTCATALSFSAPLLASAPNWRFPNLPG